MGSIEGVLMSFFGRFSKSAAQERLLEEALYSQVTSEIKDGIIRDGLWTKAFAKAGGDELRTKAIYCELRVQSIKDEINLSIIAQEEEEKLKRKLSIKDGNENKFCEQCRTEYNRNWARCPNCR